MKITPQKGFSLNEADRLQLITLLAKAGYSVRVFKEKETGKTAVTSGIEFWTGECPADRRNPPC